MKKLIALTLMMLAAPFATAGDAAAGKEKSVLCVGCHSADGNSPTDSFPKIAGQNERYIIKQLQDIKNGERQAPLMLGIVAGLTDEDMENLAAYFSGQEIKVEKAKADSLAKGEEIYRAGVADKGVAACTACHMADGSGNDPAGFPALGGQFPAYLQTQLKAFRSGARTNDGESRIMRDIAERLSDKEIEAVSNYISGLN